ncbi:MAG: hypothetical protein ACOYO1_20270 [Bacteroidales bacterium]
MNYLLAKTKAKRARKGDMFKVLSNVSVYQLPDDLNNPKEYDTNYKLEEDEWFAISSFSTKEYCIDFLKIRFISAGYNEIQRVDYGSIDFLCSIQDGVYFFQKLSASQIVRRDYISFNDEPKFIVNEPIIVIENLPDAIYIKNTDILYFKKLTSITGIFKGIDELYKEATEQETVEFLENDFIKLDKNYSAEKVKTANRKRIAMAMETLQKYTAVEKKDMFSYIREYCDNLNFDEANQNFTISDEEELKKLLFGIEQRYYTTRFGNERRLANSIITI